MTDGERMIWAVAFVDALKETHNTIVAASQASNHVTAARRARDEMIELLAVATEATITITQPTGEPQVTAYIIGSDALNTICAALA